MCRYLHEVCLPAVVHRNFKSGNILLDNQLNPHLSDCGIADLSSHVSNRQVYIRKPLSLSLKPCGKDPLHYVLGCRLLRCSCVRWLVCGYCGDSVVMGGCRYHHTGWDHLGTVPQSLPCLVFTQWRVMFIALVLSCWRFWQDASLWTGE